MSLTVGKLNPDEARQIHRALCGMDAQSRLVAGTLCVLALVGLVPIFLVKLPPLVDYPNHLARMWIIAQLPHDPILQRFYEIHWRLIPDLAMDLIVPWLIAPFGIWLAGKLFIGLTLLLTISGAAALGWSIHRRLSPSLICIPILLYGTLFLLGLLNFFFGVGLSLWGAAWALVLREAPPAKRVMTNAAFATALYCCHLFGLGLYGLILLSCEMAHWREWRQDWRRRATLFCLPFIPPFLFLFAMASQKTISSMVFSLPGKLTGLLFVAGGYGGPLVVFAAIVFGAALIIRRSSLVIPRTVKFFLGIGVAVWLAMPFVLFGSALADARLPSLLVIVALCMIDLRLNRREAAVFCAFLATVALTRYGLVAENWHKQARTFSQFERSFEAIPPGSRILTATMLPPKKFNSLDNVWMIHMPSAAIIERSDFVTLEFTSPAGQILQVHPAFQNMKPTSAVPAYINNVISETPDTTAENPSARSYWINWRRKFNAIYLLNAPPGTPSPSPDMQLVYQGDRFQLYRVRRRGSAG